MPTIKSMDGMVRYLEDAGFEVTKEYFSSSRRYLFTIKKYQFERSEYFTYPEKDGTDKYKIMKDFCDLNNDCSKYKHCEGCPHTVDNAYRILFISCKCSLVNDGDPCPYFEDLENEMDENKA